MAKVKDPVCGMELDSTQAPAQAMYNGQPYYFCSDECRETFTKHPAKYVGGTTIVDPEPLADGKLAG